MLRYSLLYLFICVLAIYAWREWYKSLCGLILLMAVIEHPDMPKTMFGIQGVNPWNVLLFIIIMAWAVSRRHEGLVWDMPRNICILLLLYLSIIIIGFFRMLSDKDCIIEYAIMTGNRIPSTAYIWGEYLINSLKWVIPGLLLYDGCRSRSRFMMGLFSLLAVYFLLSIQVIKWMLPVLFAGEDLSQRSAKILVNEIGYHRVNLSTMLAGASWAIFSARHLIKHKHYNLFIVFTALTVFLAQLLTGGRAGYFAWAGVGLILCSIRWRKHLILLPLLVFAFSYIIPGVSERIMKGFDPESRDINPRMEDIFIKDDKPHWYTITSGRSIAWPYEIEKIKEAPFFGHGRMAMQRTGIAAFLWREFGESFPHPHNAYLELLLDSGFFGFFPVMVFYFFILKYSLSLFRDLRHPIFVVIGGVTLSLVLAQLIGSFGSQTFYPREGTVGIWCSIGLMLRIYVECKRSFAANKETIS